MSAMHIRLATLGLLLLWASACGGDAPREMPATSIEDAHSAVRSYFEHVSARDCDRLVPLIANELEEGDCEEHVHDMHQRGVTLARIGESNIDQRRGDAVVVHVRVNDRGEERPMVFRVELGEEGWRVRF